MMFENDLKNNKKLLISIFTLLLIGFIFNLVKCTISKPAGLTEEQLYTSFYEGAKQISTDDAQRKIIANCLLEKVKLKYGSDFENLDLNKDKKLLDSITTECAKTITKISWTPEIEEKMLTKFKSMDELDGVSPEKKNIYAKCVLEKLKANYPAGLNGSISQKEMGEIYLSCIEVLK